ncbi:MAG: DUF3362 domain-containing protein, partial [Firmicutes bacterium]|nr:DUF3362 domain-containing protein [Bacillota bacterium]
LMQYRNPKNYELVEEALKKAGRTDLIGFDKNCLIRPRKNIGNHGQGGQNAKTKGVFKKDKPKETPKKKKTIRNIHKKKN